MSGGLLILAASRIMWVEQETLPGWRGDTWDFRGGVCHLSANHLSGVMEEACTLAVSRGSWDSLLEPQFIT